MSDSWKEAVEEVAEELDGRDIEDWASKKGIDVEHLRTAVIHHQRGDLRDWVTDTKFDVPDDFWGTESMYPSELMATAKKVSAFDGGGER